MSDWNLTLPSYFSGTVPDADELGAVNTLLTSLTDAWTDFSASLAWTGSVTNPVLNNGTVTAQYKRYGKTVIYGGRITMGSTTTFGSGTWFVSLPIVALDISNYVGSALIYDASVSTARNPGVTILAATNTLTFYGSNGSVTNTAPFTWAQSDVLSWQITYQAA